MAVRCTALSGSQSLLHLLKETGPWAGGGLLWMLIGISLCYAVILPRLYICPSMATCANAIYPSVTALQNLRTGMQYWLHIGCILVGIGLGKLVAYQSWLSMKRGGKTVRVLDLTIGVLKGSAWNAVLLLLHRHYRALSLFTLCHITIITLISLVVGFSISPLSPTGPVKLSFTYPQYLYPAFAADITITDSTSTAFLRRMDDWWINRTRSDLDAFSGTFVTRDSRMRYASNTRPSGPRVTGILSCPNIQANLTVTQIPPLFTMAGGPGPSSWFNVTYHYETRNITWTIPNYQSFLQVQLLSEGRFGEDAYFKQYLWLLPEPLPSFNHSIANGTTLPDNSTVAMCEHIISLSEISMPLGADASLQYLQPTPIGTRSAPHSNWDPLDNWNIGFLITKWIEAWWLNRQGPANWARPEDWRFLSCTNDALGPPDGGRAGECSVTSDSWNATVTAAVDTLVLVLPGLGNKTQTLWAFPSSISPRQWWLQGIIPVTTFLLYVVCVGYTLHVDPRTEKLEEFDWSSVIHLVDRKGLTQTGEAVELLDQSNTEEQQSDG